MSTFSQSQNDNLNNNQLGGKGSQQQRTNSYNNRYQNVRNQQSGGYQPINAQNTQQYPQKYPQQYPQQGVYPPQTGVYPQSGAYPQQGPYPQQGAYPSQTGVYPQQGSFPLANQYGNYPQNNSQFNSNPQYGQQYSQYESTIQNPNVSNEGVAQSYPPPPIPQTSPLLRHPLSHVVQVIKKNMLQFSPQFQRKFKDNEDFKSLNRKIVFIPSFMIIAFVLYNRKQKWWRLTTNPTTIRYSLVSLLMLHITTNVLYVAAYKDLITRNRQRIQKIVVREQFLQGGKTNSM